MSVGYTCTQAAAALQRGEVTPRQLVESCLAQIDRHESRVKAWVRIDRESALSMAQQRSDELRAGGSRGPLHGVPLGIKDIVDVEGVPTEAGSPLLRGKTALQDSPLVARLKQAGAIIIGKTVTTEFASFDPPPTCNPWNLERTPGGSSSGSAAAVALGMCCAAIGSQTGGSITRPASFCGVAGYKPAWNTVPLAGIVPLSPYLDHPGPMARSVADLRLIHQVIADTDTPSSWPMEWQACRNREADAFDDLREITLGVIEDFFISEASTGVQRATRDTIARLAAAGAKIQTVSLPASFATVLKHHRRLMARGAAEAHGELFKQHASQFGRHIAELITDGLAVTDAELAESLDHQQTFRREMLPLLDDVDALLTPSTVTVAPTIETTGDPRFNAPWSFSGFPTVSIPCGLADDDLPVSLQLAGKPWLPERLFGAASWCERVMAFDYERVMSSAST